MTRASLRKNHFGATKLGAEPCLEPVSPAALRIGRDCGCLNWRPIAMRAAIRRRSAIAADQKCNCAVTVVGFDAKQALPTPT